MAMDCPRWSEKIPPTRAEEFRKNVENIEALIQTHCRTTVINNEILRQWHFLLFRKFVPKSYYAGNFRQDDRDSMLCLGVNVGVGEEAAIDFRIVLREMAFLESWIQTELDALEPTWKFMDKRARCLNLAHFLASLLGRFIKIHPFINGNGRISRLIWEYGLIRFGVPKQCRVHPRPEQPYGELMKSAMKGDVRPLKIAIFEQLSIFNPNIEL